MHCGAGRGPTPVVGAMTVAGMLHRGSAAGPWRGTGGRSVAGSIRRTRARSGARHSRHHRGSARSRRPSRAGSCLDATRHLTRDYFPARPSGAPAGPAAPGPRSSVGLPAIPASVAAFELLVKPFAQLFLEHVSRRGSRAQRQRALRVHVGPDVMRHLAGRIAGPTRSSSVAEPNHAGGHPPACPSAEVAGVVPFARVWGRSAARRRISSFCANKSR